VPQTIGLGVGVGSGVGVGAGVESGVGVGVSVGVDVGSIDISEVLEVVLGTTVGLCEVESTGLVLEIGSPFSSASGRSVGSGPTGIWVYPGYE
jgi:hypothetical protein